MPPDLFVKALTRECIEETIKRLLQKGDLEEILNESVFGLELIEPYVDVDYENDEDEKLLAELRRELHKGIVLFGEDVDLIARKSHNDDIVVQLKNKMIAVVHLTWKGVAEKNGFPITRLYKNEKEFWKREMRNDILEFKTR